LTDATFEEGAYSDQPLRLAVESTDDLTVASALVQDAVGLSGEIAWMPRRHRLVLLINRFRWEDRETASRSGRPFERVRSALIIDGVLRVQAMGLDPKDKDVVFSVLTLTFDPGEDGAGRLSLTLAGDGEIGLDVECLDLKLIDLTRPWQAQSESMPKHDPD
jgi:hypothetical protein